MKHGNSDGWPSSDSLSGAGGQAFGRDCGWLEMELGPDGTTPPGTNWRLSLAQRGGKDYRSIKTALSVASNATSYLDKVTIRTRLVRRSRKESNGRELNHLAAVTVDNDSTLGKEREKQTSSSWFDDV